MALLSSVSLTMAFFQFFLLPSKRPILFILPFMFVYNPVLLMQGGALEILQSLITALLGIYSLSAALEKFVFKWNINQAERLVLLASALLLIIPGTITDLIGFAVLLGIFLIKTAEEKKGNYAKA